MIISQLCPHIYCSNCLKWKYDEGVHNRAIKKLSFGTPYKFCKKFWGPGIPSEGTKVPANVWLVVSDLFDNPVEILSDFI